MAQTNSSSKNLYSKFSKRTKRYRGGDFQPWMNKYLRQRNWFIGDDCYKKYFKYEKDRRMQLRPLSSFKGIWLMKGSLKRTSKISQAFSRPASSQSWLSILFTGWTGSLISLFRCIFSTPMKFQGRIDQRFRNHQWFYIY